MGYWGSSPALLPTMQTLYQLNHIPSPSEEQQSLKIPTPSILHPNKYSLKKPVRGALNCQRFRERIFGQELIRLTWNFNRSGSGSSMCYSCTVSLWQGSLSFSSACTHSTWAFSRSNSSPTIFSTTIRALCLYPLGPVSLEKPEHLLSPVHSLRPDPCHCNAPCLSPDQHSSVTP